MWDRRQHARHRGRNADAGRKRRDRIGRVDCVLIRAEDEPRHHLDPRLLNRCNRRGDIDLSIDATETNLNSDKCLFWHSNTLKRLIGMAYARRDDELGYEHSADASREDRPLLTATRPERTTRSPRSV